MSEELASTVEALSSVLGDLEELKKQVTDRFDAVERTQQSLEGKVAQVNDDVQRALDAFSQESTGTVKGNAAFFATFTDSWKTSMETLQEHYTGRVEELVRRMEGKTSKVETIYEERDALHTLRIDMESWAAGFRERSEAILEKVAEVHNRVAALEKHQVVVSDRVGSLATEVQDLTDKCHEELVQFSTTQKKLKRIAHTHKGLRRIGYDEA